MKVSEFMQKEGLVKLWSRNATLFMCEMFGYYSKSYLKSLYGLDWSELHVSVNEFMDSYGLESEKKTIIQVAASDLQKSLNIEDFYENKALPIFDKFSRKTKEWGSLAGTSDPETLKHFYTEFCDLVARFLAPCYYLFFAELAVDQVLIPKIKSQFPDSFNEAMETISTPLRKTGVVNERKEFLQLKIDGCTDLREHMEKWNWFPFYNPSDEPYDLAHYEKKFTMSPEEAKLEYEGILREENEHRKKYDALLSEADEELKNLIKIANEASYYREFRTEVRREGFRDIHTVFESIGSLFSITGKDVCFMMKTEVQESLRKQKLTVSKGQIQLRKRGFALFCGDSLELLPDSDTIRKKFDQLYESRSSLTGNIGCSGFATGPAVIIDNIEKLSLVKAGDVLVASMTAADYVPAMKKASAIVTDEGGITCHAAVIARELNTPCVISTKSATKVFSDGDILEVDANKGIVRKEDG